MLWEFEHYWDQIEDETNMIKMFNDEELLIFYENKFFKEQKLVKFMINLG
jgi:DNA polymerase III delta subunit